MATATAAAMKPTLFVLKSNLKWTPFLRSPNAFKPLFDSRIMKPLKISSCKSYGFTLKCLFANNSSNSTVSKKKLPAEKIQESPLEKLANIILKALKVLQTPAVAAVVVGLLLMYDPNSALAASGGRVGGQSFSSRSSCSSSSRSYSVPRTSAGSFSYSAPYYGSSPFRSGGKIRPVTRARERGEEGVTEGLTRIETELRELKEDLEDLDKHYNSTGPAVGVIFFLFVFTLVFTSVYGFLSYRSEGGVLTATEKTSVLKLQVGLMGMGRTLQQDLDRIAETADTSTSEGLGYVLTETTLALLRHPDYCISAYSSTDIKRNMEEGEERFNQLSIEERGKFDEETLVNVSNIKKRSSTSQIANGFSNEYLVVTVLVAAEGVYKLPTINGSSDLKEALQKLASIPARETLAVEVLWTPQKENDALSECELLDDYPLLRPL